MPIAARLPHRLGIILPSRDRSGARLGSRTRRAVRERVGAWFSAAFPGRTSDRMQMRPRLRGYWESDKSITIEEIEEIWVYCTKVEARRHEPRLVALAEWICETADQDAVAILIDAGMQIVVRGESG